MINSVLLLFTVKLHLR